MNLSRTILLITVILSFVLFTTSAFTGSDSFAAFCMAEGFIVFLHGIILSFILVEIKSDNKLSNDKFNKGFKDAIDKVHKTLDDVNWKGVIEQSKSDDDLVRTIKDIIFNTIHRL